MGLDNYIILQIDPQVKLPKHFDHLKDSDGDYEICYWRRTHRIRNFILEIVQERYNEASKYYEILPEDIDKIIQKLKSYNRRNWPINSYYEWPFAKRLFRKQIRRLKRVRRLRAPYKLIFIDSF